MLRMFKRKKKAGVYAVIFNEDKEVLLIHRTDHDVWEIPGGGLEKYETPWDAVIREVKEETGLDVKVVKLVGVYSRPRRDELMFSFLCEVVGGTISKTPEADQIHFFSVTSLPRNIPPQKVQRIHDALDGQERVFLRRLEGPPTTQWIKEEKL